MWRQRYAYQLSKSKCCFNPLLWHRPLQVFFTLKSIFSLASKHVGTSRLPPPLLPHCSRLTLIITPLQSKGVTSGAGCVLVKTEGKKTWWLYCNYCSDDRQEAFVTSELFMGALLQLFTLTTGAFSQWLHWLLWECVSGVLSGFVLIESQALFRRHILKGSVWGAANYFFPSYRTAIPNVLFGKLKTHVYAAKAIVENPWR